MNFKEIKKKNSFLNLYLVILDEESFETLSSIITFPCCENKIDSLTGVDLLVEVSIMLGSLLYGQTRFAVGYVRRDP